MFPIYFIRKIYEKIAFLEKVCICKYIYYVNIPRIPTHMDQIPSATLSPSQLTSVRLSPPPCPSVRPSPQVRWGWWPACCLPSWCCCLGCSPPSTASGSRAPTTTSGLPSGRRTTSRSGVRHKASARQTSPGYKVVVLLTGVWIIGPIY